MHRTYALNFYAIGKIRGFDTFMLTLNRSFVKCFLKKVNFEDMRNYWCSLNKKLTLDTDDECKKSQCKGQVIQITFPSYRV